MHLYKDANGVPEVTEGGAVRGYASTGSSPRVRGADHLLSSSGLMVLAGGTTSSPLTM